MRLPGARRATGDGASPSGKAPGFGPGIRRFESCRPSQLESRRSMTKALKIFTGNANPSLARAICDRLGIELGRADVSKFSDGEISVELGENVRERLKAIELERCPQIVDAVLPRD